MRALLFALIAVAPLSAQQPASDAIPRDLAIALIAGYRVDRPAPNIVVGRVPASFPPNTLPANANVLGGIERSPGTSVVLTLPESPETARASLVRHLEGSGWRLADRERGQGFVPAASEMPQSFCRYNAALAFTVRERSQGGSLVMLTSRNTSENIPCDENDRRAYAAPEGPELPGLEAPSGARTLGSGMSSGREAREASTRLESPMSSADLAAHYARQLTGAGWTVSRPMVGEGVVVYGVRHRDDENRALAGILLVLDIPGSQQREVLLRLARDQRRP